MIYETIDSAVEAGTLNGVNALKLLVTELYRVSMLSNNASPGVYPLPADALRDFIAGGLIQSNYAPVIALTSNQLANARLAVSNLLASPPPRPLTNVVLRLRGDTCANGIPLYDNVISGGIIRLVDAAGQPFTLPETFTLLPGSELAVFAFADPEISSDVPVAVPVASDPDQNGNLLIDSWEDQFFAGTPHGAFSDNDADGYQNLQEMLAGSDPEDVTSVPSAVPVVFTRPRMRVAQLPNGSLAVRWTWPSQYASSFVFGLRLAPDVAVPFGEIATAFSQNGDEFTVIVTPPPSPRGFYSLVVRLR
jgi:hypothetical protein